MAIFLALVNNSHPLLRYHESAWKQSGWCRLEALSAGPLFAYGATDAEDCPEYVDIDCAVYDEGESGHKATRSFDHLSFIHKLDGEIDPLCGDFFDPNDRNHIKPVRDLMLKMLATFYESFGGATWTDGHMREALNRWAKDAEKVELSAHQQGL